VAWWCNSYSIRFAIERQPVRLPDIPTQGNIGVGDGKAWETFWGVPPPQKKNPENIVWANIA